MSCTCGSNKKFHLANCESIQSRPINAIQYMVDKAFTKPDTNYYYITLDDDRSYGMYMTTLDNLRPEDWIYTIQAGGSGSITLKNGSGLIFIPQWEAKDISMAEHIFVEMDNATEDLVALLSPHGRNISVVDPKTYQLL